jgi:hypothetical protein
MQARIYISIFLLAICSFACTSPLKNSSKQESIVHVVLVWLKEADNKQHIQQVVEVSKQLQKISEIQDLKVGKSISSKRKIVDDSFDVGIYMTFASKADMERYLLSEKHKQAVQTTLKPLSKKILVYDFSISSFDSNF